MTSEPVIARGRAATQRGSRWPPWAYLALLLCVLTALAANVLSFVRLLPLLDEVGYPDTFTLYDARRWALTGHLYRGPDEVPYNPIPYSPLLYLVLSVPFRLGTPANPFLGARLTTGAFFVLCVLVAASMTRRLARHRSVVGWAWLLGGSVLVFGSWALQTRGDFPALFFALLSTRLLMSRGRHASALAGLAAGAAFAFRLTSVAAALAGLLWLVWRRRPREAATFSLSAAVTGAGGYLVFALLEPRLFDNLLAFRSSLYDHVVWLKLAYTAASAPIFLLAVSALPLALRRTSPRRQLLLAHGAIAGLVGSLTALQPGANVNYFFETLFVAVPFASAVPPRLYRLGHRVPVVQILLAVMLLIFQLKPALGAVRAALHHDVRARNAEWAALESLLRDRRVFSSVPAVAFLTPAPPLTEPFLVRFLERQGRFDPGPLATRIRAGEFDLVVTDLHAIVYRGVEHLSPTFRAAIHDAYAPFCALEGRRQLYHLPRDPRDSGPLRDGLLRLGCTPVGDRADGSPDDW